jgi:hypothetical protein
LHFRETLRRDCSNATVVDRVLERLTLLLEQRGCSSLAGRQFHTGEIGGMVHTLDQDRPAAVVDHGNGSGPASRAASASAAATTFRATSRVNTFFSANCADAAGGSNVVTPIRSPHAMTMRMMISPLAADASN